MKRSLSLRWRAEGRRAATVYQLWLAGGPDAKEWID